MRPQQPDGHESKCPCHECETWAMELLTWEELEVRDGRDPWKEFKNG